jgi:hypothetical protein
VAGRIESLRVCPGIKNRHSNVQKTTGKEIGRNKKDGIKNR